VTPSLVGDPRSGKRSYLVGSQFQERTSDGKDRLPVVDVDESEKITVAVRADDLLEDDTANPDRHPCKRH
jgi:hypothetical protein